MMDNNQNMGGMMDMMAQMMGGGSPHGTNMMKDMMEKMLPQGMTMILSQLSPEQRLEFAEKVVANLIEKGTEGMTKEQKEEFTDKLVKKIKPDGA